MSCGISKAVLGSEGDFADLLRGLLIYAPEKFDLIGDAIGDDQELRDRLLRFLGDHLEKNGDKHAYAVVDYFRINHFAPPKRR